MPISINSLEKLKVLLGDDRVDLKPAALAIARFVLLKELKITTRDKIDEKI